MTNLICEGELQIVQITDDLYDEVSEIFREVFVRYENICIATNLIGSQQTRDEMDMLLRVALNEGISFAAKDVKTGKVAAILANKIMLAEADKTAEKGFQESCSLEMECVKGVLTRMESDVDLFDEWKIDCMLELLFLATRPEYGRRGLGRILIDYSVNFGRRLFNGTLNEQEQLSLPENIRKLKPKAACAVFTTNYTQSIGEKLNFETINKISYEEFVFQGKTFAEKLDPKHKFCVFAAIRF